MSNTPFTSLGSVEILAAYINGLQAAVNNLESALNMGTTTATGHALTAVADQIDTSQRYRIYEGSIRLWQTSPTPTIKRNGTTVNTGQYTLLAAQGTVVFASQQLPGDVITADVTYLRPFSNDLSNLTDAIAPVQRAGTYRANNVNAGALVDVTLPTNTIEAFPFPVYWSQNTFDRIAVYVATVGAAGTKCRLGIYSDNGLVYPGSLILDAGEVLTDTTGLKELNITQTLTRGLYWLVRLNNGTPALKSVPATSAISIGLFTDTDTTWSIGPCVSRAGTFAYGVLPGTFPASGSVPITGGNRGSVWLRKQ